MEGRRALRGRMHPPPDPLPHSPTPPPAPLRAPTFSPAQLLFAGPFGGGHALPRTPSPGGRYTLPQAPSHYTRRAPTALFPLFRFFLLPHTRFLPLLRSACKFNTDHVLPRHPYELTSLRARAILLRGCNMWFFHSTARARAPRATSSRPTCAQKIAPPYGGAKERIDVCAPRKRGAKVFPIADFSRLGLPGRPQKLVLRPGVALQFLTELSGDPV
jgi:hypothetical protein